MELVSLTDFIHSNGLIAFSIMLLAGIVGGQVAHRARYFPRLMGYIFAGFILGPHVFGILTSSTLTDLVIFEELAIGLILFELGVQVKLKALLSRSVILWTALFHSLIVFIIIFCGLLVCNINMTVAALAAAIGISISPAIILLIANEYGMRSIVIKHSLMLTALNNIIAFLIYAIVIAINQNTAGNVGPFHEIIPSWLYPFYRMIGSIVVASLLSLFMITIGRFIDRKENIQFILLVGMLILALGISKLIYISPFLTMLAFGIFTVNFDRKEIMLNVKLGHMGEIFVVLLFVVVGAKLRVDYFVATGWLALAFIIFRSCGSMLSILLLKNTISLNYRQGLSLVITLFPMAGIAIALLGTTELLANESHEALSFIILPAVALLEIVGPITTVFGLKWAGEIDNKLKLEH